MNNIIEKHVEKITQPDVFVDARSKPATQTIPLAVKGGAFSFVLVVAGAEIITTYVGVIPGAVLYSLLLVVLTNLAYFSRTAVSRQMALAFTLLPMLRILSLAMPIQQVAPILRYVMTGIPLLLSTLLIIRVNGLPSLRLNLSGLEWVYQIIIGTSGVPLGIIAALTLVPPPEMVNDPNLLWMFMLWIVYTLFGGVLEEIIFRGVLQKALSYPFGFFGAFLSSVLYASMFLGTLLPGYVIFYGVTGLLFAIWAHLSDSLVGVIVAHSLMNIVFLLFIYLF